MPTYIMLSKLTPEGTQTIKTNPQRIREVNREIEQLGATVKAQWAVLGRFDFVNVVEAPDEKTIARVSLELGSRGTVQYETLTAIPIDDFISLALGARAAEGPRHRRRRARARDRARARALAAGAGAAVRARQRRASPPTRGCSTSRSTTSPGWSRPRRRRASTLTVVGPEVPLVAGVVDAFEAAGLRCFGPRAAVAELEGSKAFSKEVMEAAGVPTAAYEVVTTVEQGMAAIERYPVVVKADGLAAGKGVVIAADEDEARAALDGFLVRAPHGTEQVVVEEFLDGRGAVAARALRRRARDPDGAGAGLQAHLRRRRGAEHRRHGLLLAGPRLRRGARRASCARRSTSRSSTSCAARHAVPRDPLRRPDADRRRRRACLSSTCASATPRRRRCCRGCARTCSTCSRARASPGGLAGVELEWDRRAAVTLVLASAGYPESPRTGDPIAGLDAVPAGIEVTHAGTARGDDGAIVTAGGRVLNVTALGADAAAARAAAYAAADVIQFDGRQLRQDIALRAVATTPGGPMTDDQLAKRRAAPRPIRREALEQELTPTASLVGIVMGSQSDMETMQKAAKELTDRGIANEINVMSAHRDPDKVAAYCQERALARAEGHHRRRRPVGRAAGRRRRAHRPAGDRRPAHAAACPPPAGSTRCCRSRRCRRACRSPASARQPAERRRAGGAHPRGEPHHRPASRTAARASRPGRR